MNTKQKKVYHITIQIIKALGVGFFHPEFGEDWGITEDEETVIDLLLTNELLFDDIATEYYKHMSRGLFGGSPLVTDLEKHLNESQINQIKHLWQ